MYVEITFTVAVPELVVYVNSTLLPFMLTLASPTKPAPVYTNANSVMYAVVPSCVTSASRVS